MIELKNRMNEEKETIELLYLKREKSIKWQIESDLWYLVECHHCETLFLIEESIDSGKDPEFVVPCPRCFNHNVIKKGQNRLLLQLKKIMAPNEINPYYEHVAKKIQIEGFDR